MLRIELKDKSNHSILSGFICNDEMGPHIISELTISLFPNLNALYESYMSTINMFILSIH
jgi:hypothetical protein